MTIRKSITGNIMHYSDDSTGEDFTAYRLTNKTGGASVYGELVEASSGTDKAFDQCSADAVDCIGVCVEAGIADASEAWVAFAGKVRVLLKDSTAATRDYWVYVSDTAGRADATNAAPPGGTVAALEIHLGEIGHALESVTAGTDELCLITIHFN